jgi:hypothetical protein
MCRGMKYNIKFKTPFNEVVLVSNLSMKETITKLQELFEDYYDFDETMLNINNHSIFNLLNPPRRCSKILRKCVTIEKVIRE